MGSVTSKRTRKAFEEWYVTWLVSVNSRWFGCILVLVAKSPRMCELWRWCHPVLGGVVKDFSPSLAELKPEEVFSPHWLITPDHPLESHDGVVADSSCPCCCWRSCWFCWYCSCFCCLQQLSEEIKSLSVCIQKVKGRWKAPVECTKERRNADQPPSASFSPSHQKGEHLSCLNSPPPLTGAFDHRVKLALPQQESMNGSPDRFLHNFQQFWCDLFRWCAWSRTSANEIIIPG